MSEIIGTVLLLAIAVIIFSSLIIYVLSMDTSPSAPNVHMVGSMDDSIATVENRGGDSVLIEDLKVAIRKGENRTHTFTGDALSEIFFDTNGNGRWDVGDYISINCSSIFGEIARWQISIAVIDQPSNAIIMSGVLQQGILHTMPPVARFTYAPWDPKTEEVVEFNASESYDPDGGDIVSYHWDFGDGTTGSGEIKVHRYSSPGNYTVTLTITDDEGQTSSTSSPYDVPGNVTVTENEPPVASFTNQSEGNGWIYFDASASYDPDGTILSYIWDFGDGTNSVETQDSTIRHQYDNSGTYNVTLIVIDDNNASDSTSSVALYGEELTVPNIPPIPSFYYTPGSPSTSTYVFFNASDSYDRDGSIVNYTWDYNNDGTADAYGVTPSGHLFSTAGYYNVTLTVTDNMGDTNSTTEMMYISSPSGYRSFLLVDNTPHDRGFNGIDNIIASLNIGDYDWAEAIDQDTFYSYHNETGWHNNSVEIMSTLLDKYDIVIWSTGDFPGDGYNQAGNNHWSTPMTEGSDDVSDHVAELAAHLEHNGTLLLCGSYAVRDLQNYGGNGVSQSEVDLGQNLGLYYDGDNNGGLNASLHSGQTGYFTDGTSFDYGPVYASGTISGIAGTSSDGADVVASSQMPIYSIINQSDTTFEYSLEATGGGTVFSDGFEDDSLNGWTVYDEDGDGYSWETRDPFWYSAHSGWYVAEVEDGDDDWLITPQVTIPEGGEVTYWGRSYGTGRTYMSLKLSENGTNVGDFTDLLAPSQRVPYSWRQYSYDLSAWAGQSVYLAFQATSAPGNPWQPYPSYLSLDDIEVTSSQIPAGKYGIDAVRGANRSITLGFDLNSNNITDLSREQYLINAINWLAEGAGYITEVHVDNDRDPSWYDDTHVDTIQEAIDRVSIGGTVIVYNGTGYNPALVDKSITLTGVGGPTINAGTPYGIKVTVDWAEISNITIQNTGSLEKGIYLTGSSATTIESCQITGAQTGINLSNSHHDTIQNNILQDNDRGIYLHQALGNEITDNDVSSGGTGIRLYSSHNNRVQRNHVYSNSGDGLYVASSENNVIWNNQLYSNTGNGIYLYDSTRDNTVLENAVYDNARGIYLEKSANNYISSNTVYGNSGNGVTAVDYSGNNMIDGNIIKNNTGHGIDLQNSSSNTVTSNEVYLNGIKGINIRSSGSNFMQYNTVNHSQQEGIYIDSSNANTVSFNTFFNNTYGLYIMSSSGNTIRNNTIYNHPYSGIYLKESLSGSNGDNKLLYNELYENQAGITLSSSGGNTIHNNILHHHDQAAVKLSSFSNTNTISNNTIYNNSQGLSLSKSNYNEITNNTVENHTSNGIYLTSYSSDNQIENNTLCSNRDGVKLSSSSNSNTISSNCLFNNEQSGVTILNADDNVITAHLNISFNGAAGIHLNQSDGTTVSDNHVWANGYGIRITASGGSGNTVTNNTIRDNTNHGIYMVNSRISTSGNNELSMNRIYNNTGDGVYLCSSAGNTIFANTVSNNLDGIRLRSSNDNTIYENTVTGGTFGIYLYSSNNNQIGTAAEGNSIYRNTGDGIYIGHSSDGNTLDNNTIWENDMGIFINASDTANIKNNHIYWHNTSAGIRVKNAWLGSSYPVQNNLIHDNTRGIEIISSSSSHIETQNILYGNEIGIYLADSDTCKIGRNNITSDISGITILSSDACTVDNNTISGSIYGIDINASNDNQIQKNRIMNASKGVYIHNAAVSNTIQENTVTINTSNQYVAYITGAGSENNKVYRNNFLNITSRSDSLAYDDAGNNSWYSSATKPEGNYWKNYEYMGRYQNATEQGYYWSIPYEIAPEDDTLLVEDRRPLTDKV